MEGGFFGFSREDFWNFCYLLSRVFFSILFLGLCEVLDTLVIGEKVKVWGREV